MDEALTGELEPMGFEPPQVEEEQFDVDSVAIAHVGSDDKWQVIKRYIDDRISFYRDDLAGLDIKNMDLAKVGERFLVTNLVAQELQALKDKVDITTEAVRESRKRAK